MSGARTIVAALSLSAAGLVAPSCACATRWAQGRAVIGQAPALPVVVIEI